MTTYPVFEPLDIQQGTSLSCKVFSGRLFFCPIHIHPEYEMVFISQGGVSSIIGENQHKLSQHHLLLIGPNLPHAFSNLDDGNYFTSRYIHVKELVLETLFRQFQELYRLEGVIDWFKRGALFSLETKQVELYEQIYQQKDEQRLLAFLRFLLSLAQQVPIRYLRHAYHQDSSQRVQNIICAINDNHNAPLTLTQMASQMNMSVSTFTRHFKKIFGVSYIEYLIGQKVDKACHLLSSSSLTITHIAWEAGFTSLSQFNKQFKQHAGVSPRLYREIRGWSKTLHQKRENTTDKTEWDIGDHC